MTALNPAFRPRREHRLARHVGKLRQRLAKAIERAFSDAGISARCEPANLWPSQGIWKQPRMDVFRWEGQIDVIDDFGKAQRRSIASWDKMSDCIKGFTMWQDGFSFEVGATEPGCSVSERYVYEG